MTKRKLYLGPLTDNRRWDKIQIRPDDVLVVTPPKSGTTWMQTIVALLFSADPDIETELAVKMPWIDIRYREISDVAARIEAMTHRRSLKSHTPMDGVPLHDEAQYFCVFRHPLDVHFSYRRHLSNTPMSFFDLWYPKDDSEGITFRRFLDGGPEGFDGDAVTLAHILRHYEAAKALAERSNVTLFHYADMSRDLAGTFDKVAGLLGITHSRTVMDRLVEAATFKNMKDHAERFAPAGGKGFFKSDTEFFHSGTIDGWRGQLTDKELAAYEDVMSAQLAPSDRIWLEYGATGNAPAQAAI